MRAGVTPSTVGFTCRIFTVREVAGVVSSRGAILAQPVGATGLICHAPCFRGPAWVIVSKQVLQCMPEAQQSSTASSLLASLMHLYDVWCGDTDEKLKCCSSEGLTKPLDFSPLLMKLWPVFLLRAMRKGRPKREASPGSRPSLQHPKPKQSRRQLSVNPVGVAKFGCWLPAPGNYVIPRHGPSERTQALSRALLLGAGNRHWLSWHLH